MAVATRYVNWLSAAAAQAEVASSQASAMAAAYEDAAAATVQPAVVAANRGLVQALASTNYLGQNAAAIADIEAAYEQMWASDVGAMVGYHADASAAAAQLAPWQQVVQNLGFHFTSSGELTSGPSGGVIANAGSFQHASLASQVSPDAGMLSSGHYATGGSTAANLGSDLLNSATASTGGFNPSIANAGLLNPGPVNAALTNPAEPG